MSEDHTTAPSVILQIVNGHRLDREEAVIAEELTRSGCQFRLASYSQLERRRVDACGAPLVVGGVRFICAALRHNGIEMPHQDCYPALLGGMLERRVWQATLAEATNWSERRGELFVKPAERAKRFPGLVLQGDRDWRLQGVPAKEKVWCSDPVCWLSEWRLYVIGGVERYRACYEGDASLPLDDDLIREALALLAAAENTPAGYAIDFGLLETGATALVEMNDGFSIGCYGGLPGSVFLELLQARWRQLLATGSTLTPH